MEFTSEQSCPSSIPGIPDESSCQKSSESNKDVKFTLSTRKRNVIPVSDNILGGENDEIDMEDTESGKVGRKRLAFMENGQLVEPDDVEKPKSSLVIPMVMQKDWRIERLLQLKSEGKLSEEEIAKLELLGEATSSSSLQEDTDKDGYRLNEPVSSMDADYDSVPIESFGLAVLRGCGWREGEGIGKTNKRVVPLRVSARRPKGLGLGADPSISRPANESMNGDAEKDSLKKSSLVKITGGIHRNLYGKVESFDEDNASVIVQLALNGKNVRVSQYVLIPVTTKEYERKSKCIVERSHDHDNHSNHKIEVDDDEIKVSSKKDHKKQKPRDITKIREKDMWARPELKVRFIDKKFKNGKLYNEKVRILDAADRENCIVEDSSGNTYFQISERWLETVVPKMKGERLMIVNGPMRGNIAILEARDKKKLKVIARLITSDEIISIGFDDVCQYLGSIEDL